MQKLANMVGSSVRLYDMVLQFLRTLFLRTRNVHYCTLRAELLMALHDLEVQDIISVDPCHKFTWCLDACIREKNVDIKRSRELQGFLDSIKRGQEQVLGDLSMTLCDPYAVNFLATSAMKILNHLITNDSMPRVHTSIPNKIFFDFNCSSPSGKYRVDFAAENAGTWFECLANDRYPGV